MGVGLAAGGALCNNDQSIASYSKKVARYQYQYFVKKVVKLQISIQLIKSIEVTDINTTFALLQCLP